MAGIESFEGAQEPGDVLWVPSMDQVHVLSHERRALDHAGESTHENEIDALFEQDVETRELRFGHAASPMPI